jgi:type IV secretory pathway VirB10-like protein
MSEPPYAPPYPPYPPQPQQQRRSQPPPQGYPPQATQPAGHQPRRRPDPETTGQVRAAYAARAELGPDYEDAIAHGLAERVEELVAYRTAELRRADELAREERDDLRRGNTHRFVLGVVSLGCGIPVTAISGAYADLTGMVISWAGIVGVNAVFAWGNRRKPRG